MKLKMTGKKERIIVTQAEFDKGHKIFSNNDHFEFISSGADESTLANTSLIIRHVSQ